MRTFEKRRIALSCAVLLASSVLLADTAPSPVNRSVPGLRTDNGHGRQVLVAQSGSDSAPQAVPSVFRPRGGTTIPVFTIQVTPASPAAGQIFSVTITATPVGGQVPTTSVKLLGIAADRFGVPLAAKPLDTNGQAIYNNLELGPGTPSAILQVSLGPFDPVFAAGFYPSPGIPLNIGQATPTVGVSYSPGSTITFGQTVSYSATVTAPVGNILTPGGTVSFSDGTNTVNNVPLVNGQASTAALPSPPVGSHPVTVSYSGDTNFAAAVNNSTSLTVTKATPIFSIQITPASPVAGQPFSVTIIATPVGGKVPTTNVKLVGIAADRFGVPLSAVALDSNGHATYSNLVLGPGTPSAILQVSVGPFDPVFAAGLYPTPGVPVNVGQATPTITVSYSPGSTISYGQTVTYTATVNAPVGNTKVPAGTVSFSDGTNTVNGLTLVNGQASTVALPSPPVAGSPHTVTVSYSGDTNFTSAVNNSTSLTVSPDTTTTSLHITTNPVAPNTADTLTATVTMSPNVGNPTGTVTIRDGGSPIGCENLPLTAANPATNSTACTPSFTTEGSHNLVATYNSNTTNISGSQSATQVLTVNKLTPIFTIQVSPSSPVAGQIFSVTITATPVNGQVPTTNVKLVGIAADRFGTPLSAVSLDSNGKATYNNLVLGPGSPSAILQVSVDSFDPVFAAGLYPNPGVPVNVGQATPTITVSYSPGSTISFGQTVTYTATVNAPSGNTKVPSGTVSFSDGTNTVNGLTLVSGQVSTAALPSPPVSGSPHTVTVTYSGDTTFASAVNNSTSLTVVADSTTTTLGIGTNPVSPNTADTLTATVTMTPNVGNPTGTVSIRDGGNSIGCDNLPLTAANPATNSTACTPSFSTPGSHNLVATYTPNTTNISGSQSATQVLSVGKLAPIFTIQVTPSTLVAGQIFSVKITATPVSGQIPTTNVTLVGIATDRFGVPLPAVALDSNGQATYNNLVLQPGNPAAILQVSLGSTDPVFAAGLYPNPGVAVNVTQATPTITVSYAPGSTISFGQTITYSATVNAPAGNSLIPGGTVSFSDGTNTVNGVALGNGQASTSALPSPPVAGSPHTVTVTYSGDTTFAAAVNNSTSLTVIADTTTTSLNVTANPVNLNTPDTLTATVTMTPNVGNPTGTVTIRDGGASIGCDNLPLTAANPATNATPCTPSFISAGNHSLVATYNSNTTNITGSQSAAQVVTVNKGTVVLSNISVTPAANPGTFGIPVQFNVSVTPPNPSPAYAANVVQFFDNGNSLGTPVSVGAGGTATLAVALLPLGQHQITAIFNASGTLDPNYATSNTAGPFSYSVIPGTGGTATHFTVSAPASVTAGSSFSVVVTALDQTNNVVGAYSGTVHLSSTDSAAILPADAALSNGAGIFSVTLKTAGNRTIDANDVANTAISGSATVLVTAASATHFIVTAPATATSGTTFGFAVAAVDPFNNTASGYGGTVHFTSSDPSASLPANAALTGGTGNFSATLKTLGTQTITATDTVTASITGSAGIQVGAQPQATGTVSPAVLYFTYFVGDPLTGLTATAFVDSNSNYTVTNPVSWVSIDGQSAGSFNVTVIPTGLDPGFYQTTLTVNFGNGNSATISVRLQVTAVLLRVTPASFNFTVPAGTTAVQTATLGVAAYGKNVPASISLSGGSWLSVTPSDFTTPLDVKVLVDPSGLTPGTYNATILITSAQPSNSPVAVAVTLTVTPSGQIMTLSGIVNAASGRLEPAAPNTIVSAYGTFPACNAGATVSIDGIDSSVFASSPTQINFLVPATVGTELSAKVHIACVGLTLDTTLPIGPFSPGIFTQAMSGLGQAAIVNQDGSIDTTSPAGTYVQVYGTGFGLLAPKGADGLAHLIGTVTAKLGGVPITVQYAGEAPGYTVGLQQINVFIPMDPPRGSSVPLVLTVNGVDTQPGVTLSIQ